MTIQLPPAAASYVKSINGGDSATFRALFADSAVVSDVGRQFRGAAAIEEWSKREIFDPQVTLEVLDVAEGDGETIVTTKVDGNFDRTGLPDPVIINHQIVAEGGKIVRLTCRLAGGVSGS